ncbi:uncharacterized protein N7482_003946, partial [Penicillium canariense]
VNGPVIVEDSALEFHAMNGLPGPYIKYFLELLGNDGLNNLLVPYKDKSADAVCTFAFSLGPTTEPLIFQGRLQGTIVAARGPPVFGWEPIFEHQGETLAEMAHDKKVRRLEKRVNRVTPTAKTNKNKLSHRYQALCKFQEWLANGENRSMCFNDEADLAGRCE